MMNHSCTPNCSHYFLILPGKPIQIIMRAIKDIAPNEELEYSYVSLYDSTVSRNRKLMLAYGFRCLCARCMANSEESNYRTDETKYPKDFCLDIDCSIDDAVTSKVIVEITTCINLSARDITTSQIVYKKLSMILNDSNKLRGLHPCSKHLLNAYFCLIKTASYTVARLVCSKEIELTLKHAIYFTFLAIASVFNFTLLDSYEISQLAVILVDMLNKNEYTSSFNSINCLRDILFSDDRAYFFKAHPDVVNIIESTYQRVYAISIEIKKEKLSSVLAEYCLKIMSVYKGSDNNRNDNRLDLYQALINSSL